jgi:hypothetical protein
MKRNYLVLFLFILTAIFASCEDKFAEGNFTFYDIEEPENTNLLPTAPEIGKKGAAFTTKGAQWSSRVFALKAHWHYSWGNELSEFEPVNIDFVPMQWGKWGPDEAKLAELKTLKEEGKIRYLLGFNEPDGAKQANMTVQEALDKWPVLESVGLPLGSPACVDPTGAWMKEFMQKAGEGGLRVDFVCVHWYGGTSAASLISKLEEVYSLYGKPIWITEFAPADWNAATPQENKHSPAAVLSFMQTVLPQLEELSYVKRYAWFSFGQESAAGTSSALFDKEGNLTALGQYYASFKPNIYIGPGKVPAVDPSIIFQDDFEAYAEGANLSGEGYVVWEGTASVGAAGAFEGDRFGQSDISKINFAIRRALTLEAGKTYSFEVTTKMQDGVAHTIQVHPKAAYGDVWKTATNAGWETHTVQFTVTAGNENVVIALYRYAKKQLAFDNIVVKEVL